MKLTIDTEKKIIQIPNGAILSEVLAIMNTLPFDKFPELKEYTIVSEKEVVSSPVYVPYNPNPWFKRPIPYYYEIPYKVTCTSTGITGSIDLKTGDTVEVINTKGESEGEAKITTGYSSPVGSTGCIVTGSPTLSWTATTWCTKEPNYDLEDE